jgi:hypothetical protein
VSNFQDFRQTQKSSNKKTRLIVGVVILAVLASLGVYSYRLYVSAQPHPAVPDSQLPSP